MKNTKFSKKENTKSTPSGKKDEKEKGKETLKFNVDTMKPNNLSLISNAISLDQNLKGILSALNATIRLDIAPNGCNITILDGKGEPIPLADIQRINSFNSFISNDEKITTQEKIYDPLLLSIYAVRMKQGLVDDKLFAPVASDLLPKLKDYYSKIEFLEANRVKTALFNDEDYKRLTFENINRAQKVCVKICTEIINGDYDQGKRHLYLAEQNLIDWIFKKLTAPFDNTLMDTREARLLYFPKDGGKGLSLTLEEWSNLNLRQNNSFLLSKSQHILNVLGSKDLLDKHFGEGFYDLPWDNIRKVPLAKLHIHAGLHITDLISFLDQKIKGKPMTADILNVDNDVEKIKALDQAFYLAQALEARKYANPCKDIYHQLFPSYANTSLDRANVNFFQTIRDFPLDEIEKGFKPYVDMVITDEKLQKLFCALFIYESKISQTEEQLKKIMFPKIPPTIPVVGTFSVDPVALMNETLELKGTNMNALVNEAFRNNKERLKPPTAEKKKFTTPFNLSVPKGMGDLIKETALSAPLKVKVKTFLCSFNHPATQALAFNRIIANLDANGLLLIDEDNQDDQD